MSIPQDQLAQAFSEWSEANPNATDADIAQAMQQAEVNPLELALALGLDPNQAINRYNQAIQQNPLSNPLTSSQSSTSNPLLSAGANTVATSLFNPESLTSTAQSRLVPGALSGVMNFAAADDVSGRKNAALNTLVSVIGGPAGTLFKSFLDQFGFFKGGGPKAVTLTPEEQVEAAYKLFQNQLQSAEGETEGEDARLIGLINDADKLGLDTTDMRNRLKTQFGIDTVPGDLPEGYVKDSQGFLRDVATEGYWLLDKDGTPFKTTPPLVNVPMPRTSGAAQSSASGATQSSASTSASSSSSSSGSTAGSTAGSTEVSPSIGEWVYDSESGLFRQVGGIETIKPIPGDYKDGQVLSGTEMQGKFGEWGRTSTKNTQATPTPWAYIFQNDGVKGVLDVMRLLNKTKEQVAEESGTSISDIDKAISDYNAQVAGAGQVVTNGNVGGAGGGAGTGGNTGGNTGGLGSTGGTVATGATGAQGERGLQGEQGSQGERGLQGIQGVAGAAGATGASGRDGRDGRDGVVGLITSLVNSTPIASQLFKPELFKAENKVSGLFDLVMRTRA